MFLVATTTAPAQTRDAGNSSEAIPSTAVTDRITATGISRTTAEIMSHPNNNKPRNPLIVRWEMPQPDRKNLPSRPGALEQSQWPLKSASSQEPRAPYAPQTIALNFDTVTGPTETDAFPPDTEGAIGPTQFVLFVNGKLRTFNKTTGAPDGVIDANPDVFFGSVMTTPGAGEEVFTSDPNVRYDRLTGRWFLNIIDVIIDPDSGDLTDPNRVLIAVSNAGTGNGVISGSTMWTFYQFQGDATRFTDYQSLGVDASALYIGADMFTLAGAFSNTKAFIIPKGPFLTAELITIYTSDLLVAGAGPFAPRGVDNYDPTNTGAGARGYFIGVDNATFNTLMIRRVTNPGAVGGAPSISGNITVATPLTTRFPVLVPHLGNTNGSNGRLDALDDRLFAAHLRNGRLWTAHNIGVNNTGVAQLSAPNNNRNAARWYELQNLATTPTVVQSGTLFDNNAPNDLNQRSYWIPTILVSGQGHVALGCSIAGANERINAFTTGRLAGDGLGALRDGPGGAALPGYTASSTAYNPPEDADGPSRRWGDYSFTSLDPKDDMTIWTIQEYCNGPNTYGCRVAKLLAPRPATPSSASPANVLKGRSSVSVTITGTVVSGSGFYDPGTAGFAVSPTRISATVTGGVVVNSVTFTDPTHVTLNLNTTAASTGAQDVAVKNPDGQTRTGNDILNIVPFQLSSAVSRKTHGSAGTFSIALPLAGTPGVECRSGGGNHTMVFTFNSTIVSGSASVVVGTGSAGAPAFSSNTMTVPLSGVTDIQKITVRLQTVTDNNGQVLPDTDVSMNVLLADTTGNKSVNSSDIGQTKSQSGALVGAGNFRNDTTANGAINSSDIGQVKSNSGHAVP